MSRVTANATALVVEPDDALREETVEALRAAGVDAVGVDDAETGLRVLAAREPSVLVVEVENEAECETHRGGVWLLRKLRDDFMGAPPRVVATAEPGALAGLSSLAFDVVVLKPSTAKTLAATVRAALIHEERARDPERLRELVRLSILSGDLGEALAAVARRLALIYRTTEAVVVGAVGEHQAVGCARGPISESPEAMIWAYGRASIDAHAPVVVSGDPVTTHLAVPVEVPGGTRLGVLMLVDEAARVFAAEVADSMGALASRIYHELAWRSVHARISADRDALRESSRQDPMLPGVWNRAALDDAMVTQLQASQARGEAVSVVLVDLRGLRQINERFGHVAGDAALRHVGDVLRLALGPEALVARYGGDVLAAVLFRVGGEEARRRITEVQDALAAAPLRHEGSEIPLVTVVGIAPLEGEEDTGEAALIRAGTAISAGKRRREAIAGEAQIVLAEPGSSAEANAIGAKGGLGLEPGTTLGGMYQILHELSRGAMGVVYRAEDLGLRRPVALKTLRHDLARDPSFVERFRSEAATLAAIHHENLVQVYAFGQDGDYVYFVMELVEGESLEERIESLLNRGRAVPLVEVARAIREIAGALQAMHQAGVLHRDVKPANILLDRIRDRAVLVDVGIAKRRGTSTDPAGTPGFTAPESFTGGVEEPTADVYGLAATAYTLLCAALPFADDDNEEVLRRQARGGPAPPTHHRAGLPAAVDACLLRALDPRPAQRYRSALAFADALAAAFAEASPEVAAGHDLHVPGASEAPESLRAKSTPPPLDEPREPSGLNLILPPTTRRAAGLADLDSGSPVHDQPASLEPRTRGVLFRAAFRVLGARQSGAWSARLSRSDPSLAQAMDPRVPALAWHPTSAFVLLLQSLGQAQRDARAFSTELGRVAARATFARLLEADPTALGPHGVLAALDVGWRFYHTWGRVTVERLGERSARVNIDGGPSERLLCACTGGFLEQAVLLAGAQTARAVERACRTAGAAACSFEVSLETRS